MKTPFFSIAIPTYEQGGHGVEFLTHSFKGLANQTFKDFEVVISDNSQDNEIKKLCDIWSGTLNLKYHKNTHKISLPCPNLNNAMKHSTGKWIKLLFQDDFLYSSDSLQFLKDHIEENEGIVWIATACEHSNDGHTMYRPFFPSWTDGIHLGNNRISSPSVITIKNTDDKQYFEEDLVWVLDCEYYKRMHGLHGEPSYMRSINVVNRTWGSSLTGILSAEIKNDEVELMRERYA